MMDQRKFHRYHLVNLIQARMSILSLNGQIILSNKAFIYIEDISASGLKFLSQLRFPVTSDMVIQIQFHLLNHDFTLNGKIVRKNKGPNNQWEYGVHLLVDHTEQTMLSEIIDKLIRKLVVGRFRVYFENPYIYSSV
jgi:hypothetical protein